MNPVKLTAFVVFVGSTVIANAQTIFSNNSAPGDYFTNASATSVSQALTNFTGPDGEVAVYREVKNNGSIGINTNLPRNGNGSLWFKLDGSGPEKSEFAIGRSFDTNGDSTGVLGLFDNMNALSADMFTLSSPVSLNQSPYLRIELFSAADNKYGQLIFDTAWDPSHSPTFNYGQWNSVNFFADPSNTWLRATSSINIAYGSGGSGERTLADWQTILMGKAYAVLSINMGFGTASFPYEGAIDNLSYGFAGGASGTYNFEAGPGTVPEPASFLALGVGAFGLIRKRRAKK